MVPYHENIVQYITANKLRSPSLYTTHDYAPSSNNSKVNYIINTYTY